MFCSSSMFCALTIWEMEMEVVDDLQLWRSSEWSGGSACCIGGWHDSFFVGLSLMGLGGSGASGMANFYSGRRNC